MHPERYLIVNADDFGLSPGVNRGIIEAHENGIVTSASLMVRWPAAADAADYARQHARLSLGIHLELGEWIHRDGAWVPSYQVVPFGDKEAVADEIDRQFAVFYDLVGKDPSHIDSHQHVHMKEPLRSILVGRAHKLSVPLRSCHPVVHYCGGFYGQTGEGAPYPDGITVDGLIEILAALPPGISELGCHPGECDDLDSVYCTERVAEVATLSDPRIRAALISMGIQLCSFGEIAERLTIKAV